MRYPRDYNTVPRVWFWLFHLLWLFPWSAFLPAALRFKLGPPTDRAMQTRLLALCWTGFLLVSFHSPTTQEYTRCPATGAGVAAGRGDGGEQPWLRYGQRAIAVVAGLAVVTISYILLQFVTFPPPATSPEH